MRVFCSFNVTITYD